MEYGKAWKFIRKGKATMYNKYPFVIELKRIVENPICNIRISIDDGSFHVGISITPCKTKNKAIIKGIIEQRKDVKKLMADRASYRRKRRREKRYRPVRFNNRSSSKRKGRLAPTIKQKKDAILRVINQLSKWIPVYKETTKIYLEDVAIDIRAMTEGYKPYNWQYQKSNRLDENLRKATILRDKNTCQMCHKKDGIKEVHHIKARRFHGADTISNLVTLCPDCHESIKNKEPEYEEFFYKIINSKGNVRFDYVAHVMQGKTYLRKMLSEYGELHLTTGGDTANKRIEWNIEKSHSNDALCISDLKPDTIEIMEYTIKPIRRKSKAKTNYVEGKNGKLKHRDLVSYTYKNGVTYTGYVTALYPNKEGKMEALNFQAPEKHCKRTNAKKTKLLWSFSHIYWL